MRPIVTLSAVCLVLALAAGCSSRRAAPARNNTDNWPTSIAYKPGQGWAWGSGGTAAAPVAAQPAAPMPTGYPMPPAAPPAPNMSNVAPFPQPPGAPAVVEPISPTPGTNLSPADWSTPSTPPMEAPSPAPSAPPADGGAGAACGGGGGA